MLQEFIAKAIWFLKIYYVENQLLVQFLLLFVITYMSKGTTFHTLRRKQKSRKHNMRCLFPLFFCLNIYILYLFALKMHTLNT